MHTVGTRDRFVDIVFECEVVSGFSWLRIGPLGDTWCEIRISLKADNILAI